MLIGTSSQLQVQAVAVDLVAWELQVARVAAVELAQQVQCRQRFTTRASWRSPSRIPAVQVALAVLLFLALLRMATSGRKVVKRRSVPVLPKLELSAVVAVQAVQPQAEPLATFLRLCKKVKLQCLRWVFLRCQMRLAMTARQAETELVFSRLSMELRMA